MYAAGTERLVARSMARGYVILFDQSQCKQECKQDHQSEKQKESGVVDSARDSDSDYDSDRVDGEEASGFALLQRKAYFQNYSIERNVFIREPVCGNPGQYTLPGGRMNREIVQEFGTLAATLKQFNEESGISTESVALMNCVDHGYYAPPRVGSGGKGAPFYVHFVEVNDVRELATAANVALGNAKSIIESDTLSSAEKQNALRCLYSESGLNDDAADEYVAVPWSELLSMLQNTVEFDEAVRDEWGRLVREQGLFFNTTCCQEDVISRTFSDPGSCRDWLIDGVKAFLYIDGDDRVCT